jgi:hypothetical protein
MHFTKANRPDKLNWQWQSQKQTLAREWLTFLALLPLGAISCFVLGYESRNFRHSYFSASFLDSHVSPDYGAYHSPGYSPFDVFWNQAFGLTNFQTIALWLLPYLLQTNRFRGGHCGR